MYKYKYTGGPTGIMTFWVDKKSYTVANNHATLKDTVELPKKVDIVGLELEEDMKRKSKSNIEGDE